MLEIDKYMIDTLKSSSAISTYTGATTTDYRIYERSPPFDVVFSATKKAAIFYQESQDMRSSMFTFPSQKGNISYFFEVVATGKTLVKQVSELIIDLFDEKGFTTTNWRVGIVKMKSNNEAPNEGTVTKPLFKRVVVFLLKECFRSG